MDTSDEQLAEIALCYLMADVAKVRISRIAEAMGAEDTGN